MFGGRRLKSFDLENASLARALRANRDPIVMIMVIVLSLTLPIFLYFSVALSGEGAQQSTFSEYVYTPARPFFIVYALGLGFALATYKGYDDRASKDSPFSDRFATNLAAVGAIVTAVFPSNTCLTESGGEYNLYGVLWVGYVHLMGVVLLAVGLALHITFGFTRSNLPRQKWPKEKYAKNTVYYICGFTLFGSTLFLAIDHLYLISTSQNSCRLVGKIGYIFYTEVLMVVATGTAWLVKLIGHNRTVC